MAYQTTISKFDTDGPTRMILPSGTIARCITLQHMIMMGPVLVKGLLVWARGRIWIHKALGDERLWFSKLPKLLERIEGSICGVRCRHLSLEFLANRASNCVFMFCSTCWELLIADLVVRARLGGFFSPHRVTSSSNISRSQ